MLGVVPEGATLIVRWCGTATLDYSEDVVGGRQKLRRTQAPDRSVRDSSLGCGG